MEFKDAILTQLEAADFASKSYLDDLSPAEMMMRTVPEANHVAWQVGHCIAAECRLIDTAVPGTMPQLPADFLDRHTKDKASIDDPAAFLSKEEYQKIARDVRAGTLRALNKMSPADLDKPVSGKVPPFVRRVGDCFTTVGAHWGLHAGQWAVLRRKLNRPRIF